MSANQSDDNLSDKPLRYICSRRGKEVEACLLSCPSSPANPYVPIEYSSDSGDSNELCQQYSSAKPLSSIQTLGDELSAHFANTSKLTPTISKDLVNNF